MKSNRFLIGQLSTDYVSGRYTPDDELNAKIADLRKKSLEPIGTTDSAAIDVTDVYTNQLDGDPSFNSVSLIVNGEGTYSQKVESSRYAAPLTFNGECRPASSAPVYRGRFSWRTPDSSYQSNHVAVTQQNSCFPIANGNWTFEMWVRYNYFFNDSVRWFDTGNNSDAGAIVFGTGSTGNVGWGRPTAGSGVGTTTAPIKMGQWHHHVFTSEAGGVNGRIFIDGVLQGGPVGYTNMTANDRSMRIGNQNVAANWSVPDMQIADFRFFNENVYPYGPNVATIGTKYFTPDPNPPQTDMVTWDGGKTYKRVDSCQLHTFADPYLTDRSKNNLVVAQSGTSPYITAESPYTELYSETPINYSVAFNRTPDYLSIPHNTDYNLDSGDWTIECWFNVKSETTELYNKRIVEKYVYAGNTDTGWTIGIQRTNGLNLGFNWFSSGGNIAYSTTNPIVKPGVWNHVAVSRKGDNIALWFNGVRLWLQSGVDGYSESATPAVSIGASSPASQSDSDYDGLISDVRLVKGSVVYDPAETSIATPTEPLTAITGTKLLICQSNEISNLANTDSVVTIVGTPRAVAQSPYVDTRSEGTWSTKHDGTNDYVTFPSSEDFNLGTNDLTIEYWVRALYPTQDVLRMVSTNYNTFAAGSMYIGRHNTAGADGRMAVFIYNYSSSAAFLIDPNFMTEDWHHYAIVRNGDDWTLYRDGVSVATRTWSGSVNTAAGIWQVGGNADSSGTYNWWGNISNYRIVKGTAVYTSDFTPPTGPLTAIPNTVLLTSQNRMFKDNSASNHSPTVVGNTKTSVVSPFTEVGADSYYRTIEAVEKDTSGSIFFDGTGDYIQAPANMIYSAWNTDFTIECWVHPVSFPATANFIWTNSTSNSDQMTGGYVYNDGSIGIGRIGLNETKSAAGTIVLNRWHHVAFVRKGTSVAIYVNGIRVATPTTTNLETTTSKPMTIGGQFQTSGNSNWPGAISNFRVIKGSALYNGNFTPPTRQLEATDNTGLLACNSKYGWTNFHPVDEVGGRPSYVNRQTGDPKLSNFSPLAPVGWSTYFDGSGDYLTIAPNSAMSFGTGDFTIEFWMNSTVFSRDPYDRRIMRCVANFNTGAGAGFGIALNGNPSGGIGQIGFSTEGSGSASVSSSGTVCDGKWHHIACGVKNGNVILYVDGVFQAQAATTVNVTDPASYNTHIGWFGYQQGFYNGYLSDIRIIKGEFLYNENFTPSSTSLTPIPGTQLLTCQDQMLTDYSLNDFFVTRNGDVKTVPFSPISGTVVPKTYSTYFDGTGDEIETTSAIVSSTEYSIEAWVYPTVNQQGYIAAQYTAGNGSRTVFLYRENTGVLYFYHPNTGSVGAGTLNLNTWYHVLVTRDSGSRTRIFVDGVLKATFTTAYTPEASSFSFGGNGEAGSNFGGYISNMRVLNGSIPGEYQTTGTTVDTQIFTPPTGPVTAITNTVLLTCQSSYNVDNSDNNFDITGSGNPKILTHNPFGYDTESQEYDPEIHGGSTFLDGNDYWQIEKSERNLTMYKGDWTAEVWVYPATSSGTQQVPLEIYGNTVDQLLIWYYSSTGQVQGILRATNQASITISGTNPGQCKHGVWTHIALEREGTALRLYVNGKLEATSTIAATTSLNEFQDNWFHQPRIGASSNNDKYFVNGNIGPLRITKRALYKGVGFVPGLDTATLKPDTVSLIKWGTSAIQSETGRNMIQVVGDVRPANVPIDQGPGSVYFDGSGDILSCASNAAFAPGTGDFTVEAWMYFNALPGTGGIAPLFQNDAIGTSGNDKFWCGLFNEGGTPKLTLGRHSTSTRGTVNWTPVVGTWYHLVFVRESGTIKMFINGVSQSVTNSTSLSGISFGQNGVSIGAVSTPVYLNGYISNLRYVVGVAVYTEDFIPPIGPLGLVPNTVLLACNGSLNDSSEINNTITVTGNAMLSELSPTYKPMTAETNSAYYFDGSGDYIHMTNSPNFVLTGEDFTIEAWTFIQSGQNAQGLINTQPHTTIGISLNRTGIGDTYVYIGNGSTWTGSPAINSNSASKNLTLNQWNHVALVRSGNTITLYHNGEVAGTTSTMPSGFNGGLYIGCVFTSSASEFFKGYIDEFRITKGVARYTSDFVPSVNPLKLRLPDPLSHKRRVSKYFTDAVTEVISGPYPPPRYEYLGQTATFSATGSDQTWVVPNDVYLITAKLWGAGGGNRSTAGAGGYTEAEISVTPGETITVMVGSDGSDSGGVTSDSYGGGGGAYSDNGNGGRQGGGRSALRSGGVDILTAGGGGGSGFNHGGYGGGGLTGRTGGGVAGSGGSQTAGGAGGSGNGGTAEAGVQYTGGISTSGYAGGGGGGGWFGGGGGSGVVNNHGGGGGGSGFVGRDGSTALTGDEWGSLTEYGENVPRPLPTNPLDLSGYRYDSVNERYYNRTKCLRGDNASATGPNTSDSQYPGSVGGASQPGYVVINY